MADVTVEFGATDTGLEKTLKAVQGELNGLKDKVKGGELSMTELESTMKRIGQVTSMEKNIKAIGAQSQDTAKDVKTLGTAAEDTGKKGEIGFGKIAAGVTLAGVATKAASMAINAARAVVQGFSDALNLGGRLSELSTRTGEAAGKLLVLETAFKNSGLEASQVGAVINKLQNFMQDAANGGEKQTKVMRDLGITMADLAGKTPSEQMEVFAKKIAAIEDPTQRAATASEVFGEKLGGKLLPLLVDFSGNIEDARSKVGSLEQVMNDNADTFDRFSESIETIKGKMVSFSAGILSETVPALEDLGSKMEGVDAAGLGKVIGQILSPAIEDLVKNIKLANQVFDLFQSSASTIGVSLNDHSDAFKKAATEANKYLQIVAALLPSGLNPLSVALKGIANVSNDATNGMNGVADAASDAAPVIDEVADSAQTTGTEIASAFSLNAEFKPQLDSIGDGWKNVGDNIGTSNSLLEGTGDAFSAIAEKTEDQVAGIGGINEQLGVSEKLQKLLLDLVGKTADKEAEAADKAAKKAEEQRKSNDLKQGELKYQLELAEAEASGSDSKVKKIKEEKKYADDIKKALEAGFDQPQAENFADAMARAADEIARGAEEADRMQKSLATKIGADIKSRQDSEAVDPGGKLMKKAQEQIAAGRYGAAEATARQIKSREQDAMIRGTGKGRDTRAIQDIARDYGLRGSDKEIRDELYKIRTEGQGTSDKVKKTLETTQRRMGEGMKKEAEKKVEEKKTPMTLEGMVKIIQEAVVKLEMKLPQPVMV